MKKMKKLRKGLSKSLDVSICTAFELSLEEIDILLKGLEYGFDLSEYLEMYSVFQVKEILKGLINSIDISLILNPEFDSYEMKEIRKGLRKK